MCSDTKINRLGDGRGKIELVATAVFGLAESIKVRCRLDVSAEVEPLRLLPSCHVLVEREPPPICLELVDGLKEDAVLLIYNGSNLLTKSRRPL